MMKYKGYMAQIEFNDDSDIFHGEIINIRDVVTFQGKSVRKLHKAFKDSVEDYLAFCKARNESPAKPFSGKFVVRLSPEQHRKVFIAAKKNGKSLNAWVTEVLDHSA